MVTSVFALVPLLSPPTARQLTHFLNEPIIPLYISEQKDSYKGTW